MNVLQHTQAPAPPGAPPPAPRRRGPEPGTKMRAWTMGDLAYLKANAGKLPFDHMVAHLRRTPSAVRKMMATHGIKLRASFLSPSEIGLATGIHSNTILKWINAGWLAAERTQVGSPAGRTLNWHVPPQAIIDMLDQHGGRLKVGKARLLKLRKFAIHKLTLQVAVSANRSGVVGVVVPFTYPSAPER